MKALTTTLFLLILLPYTGFAQVTEQNAPVSNTQFEPLIYKICENKVSANTLVHTYKLNTKNQTNASNDTDIMHTDLPTEIRSIVELLSNASGVSECSFDGATQTFTIVTALETNIQVFVDEINKN